MSNYITVKDSVAVAKDNVAFAKEQGIADALLANFVYNLTRTLDIISNGEVSQESEEFQSGVAATLHHWNDAVQSAFAGLNLLEVDAETINEATEQDLATSVLDGRLTETEAIDLGLTGETLEHVRTQKEFSDALASIFGLGGEED